jgi:hypothetical protein
MSRCLYEGFSQLLLKSAPGNQKWSYESGNRAKGKGCDIGYALAVSSCEEANSVDACTVTALDAITALAVPDPNCSSQSQSVFSGPAARLVALPSESLSLLRISNVLFSLTLSAVDGCQAKHLLQHCQRRFSVQSASRRTPKPRFATY